MRGRLIVFLSVVATGVAIWWAMRPLGPTLAPGGTAPSPRILPAPPVPKETALVPSILVDDFEAGQTQGIFAERKNRLDAFQGTWARRPSYTVITLSKDDRPGRGGHVLRLEYSKLGGWCGWYTLLNGIDVSRYNALTFWVKGERGGERFDIGLADEMMQELEIDAIYAGPIMAFLPQGVTTEWQQVRVPLAGLRSDLDLKRMGSLVLWFRYEGRGVMEIDDVAFVYDPEVERLLQENLPKASPDPRAPRATWVWKYDPVNSQVVHEELLVFCKRTAIQTLYLYLGESPLPKTPVEFQRKLAQFLRECHANGIDVHALQGNPLWALKEYHSLVMEWVEGFLLFNKDRPPEERMDGVHLDIEPYLTASWETGEKEKIKSEFVELLGHLRQRIESEGETDSFLMGVAIPIFYDREGDFEEQLLAHVDYAALMDYYDSGIDIVERGRFHTHLANRLGKKMTIGVETQDLVRLGQGRRRNTFHEEGWEEMERQLASVVDAFAKEPSFGGIAIHAYDSYRLLQRGRNVPTRERPLSIPPLAAFSPVQPIVIDGNVSDWADAAWITVDRRPQVVYGVGAWGGAQDTSFRMALSWEPEALQVAIEATDDLLVQEKKGGDMWEGDHAELWIDVDLVGDYSEAVNSTDDFQVGLSPGNFRDVPPEVHVWVPSVDPASLKQVQFATRQTPSGYTLEARFPTKFLFQTLGKRVGVDPVSQASQIPRRIAPQIEAFQNGVLADGKFQPKFKLGLMVDLSDCDDPRHPQKSLLSTSPERQWGDPTTFNMLELQ